MIGQDTIPSELDYCKKLVHALKTKQSIDSSRAALYQDTTIDDYPIVVNYTLAPSETKLTAITFSHPDSPTPYAQLMLDFYNGSGASINFTIYRDPLGITDEYSTRFIVQVRNLSAFSTNFDADYRVKSSAPGTLAAVIL